MRASQPADSAPPPQRVLIVDDLEDARTSIQQLLKLSLKLECDTAADGVEALKLLEAKAYSVVLTDLRMPKMTGQKLMEEIQARRLPCTVIVTTGHGGVPEAVKAMRQGAYDFLTKPPDPQHLAAVIERALRERRLQDEVAALREQVQGGHTFRNVLSKSPKMLDVFELIGHVAPTGSTILILGETGTGKEQIARAIHDASRVHRQGAFVAVNCAAVPETLLESELFGHEKGSFTGAAGQRKGRFEQADGGTLFLDEVGDIPLAMQVKLLRVLQERRIERVGGSEPIDIDVRIIAATHQDLGEMVQDGAFREDLYYRLNVIRIELPPLRQRPEDVPILATHFAVKYARAGNPPPQISPEAMDVLLAANWPGNVRQLENAIERACVTTRDGIVRPENLPPDLRAAEATVTEAPDLTRPLPDQVAALTAAFEERYLRAALEQTHGHVGKAAELSGLSRRSVTERIAQYGIARGEFKGE